ncbi:MAG: hypothetical protein ACRC28_09745 [Clostridium sp.]|uniref:hypothetical protein n=1 Tax=Clostridium sp. TaxID=1506 RepID=UPI003F2D1CA1
MNIEVFEFLGKEAPNAIENIREAMDLLISSMDDAMGELGEKLQETFAKKQFEKILELNKYGDELNSMNEKLQELLNNLDDIICSREVTTNENEIKERSVPNYDDYLVDTKVEHSLYESLTYKRPCAIKIEEKLIEIKDWKSALVETLNYLAQKDYQIVSGFTEDPKMHGKKVKYFSKVESEIIRDPRKIDKANIYVETSLSANGIRNLLVKILKKFNIKLNDYKIYLKADYSELH